MRGPATVGRSDDGRPSQSAVVFSSSAIRRSISWLTSRIWPRSRSVSITESSAIVPSGSSAGMSTALCRAYTPGAGSGGSWMLSLTRCAAGSRCVFGAFTCSRWVSTIAPIAAVISSAPVTSKAHT